MSTRLELVAVWIAATVLAATAVAQQKPATEPAMKSSPAFEQLKPLVGDWDGQNPAGAPAGFWPSQSPTSGFSCSNAGDDFMAGSVAGFCWATAVAASTVAAIQTATSSSLVLMLLLLTRLGGAGAPYRSAESRSRRSSLVFRPA